MSNLYLDFKHNFEEYLNEYLSSVANIEPVASALKYSILNGGKRIRPYLVFLGAKAVSKNVNDKEIFDNIKELAVGIELIHSYSLVHDDLPCMDNDTLRRGKPTTHIKYGAGIATITGDAMLNAAYEIMLAPISKKACIKEQVLAAKYLMDCAGINGMVGGQCLDLKEDKSNYSLEDFVNMNLMKTGALIRGSLVAGAIRYGASDSIIASFEEYANNVGILFQVVDDILDVTSTEEVLGKNIGSDVESNKTTYIDYVGMDQAKLDCVMYANRAKSAITKIEEEISNADTLYKFVDDMLVRNN